MLVPFVAGHKKMNGRVPVLTSILVRGICKVYKDQPSDFTPIAREIKEKETQKWKGLN